MALTENLALAVLAEQQATDEGAVRAAALQAELVAARMLAEQQEHVIGDSRSSAMVSTLHARRTPHRALPSSHHGLCESPSFIHQIHAMR